MTTLASVLARAQNRLRSTYKRRLTRLDGAVLAGAESLIVDSATGIQTGGLICVDREVFYVVDVDATTITVIPGFAGTTAAAHADNSLVEINYAHAMTGLLYQHAQDELRSWPPDLYRIDTTTVTLAADVRSYDTGLVYGTTAFALLRGYLEPASGDITLHWADAPFHTIKNAPAALGGRLALVTDFAVGAAGTLHVEYAAPYDLTTFELSTDLVATTELRASMLDVLALGIAYRALSEITSVDTQAQVESRNNEEVAPGQITGVRDDLFREYRRRKGEEHARLLSVYPARVR